MVRAAGRTDTVTKGFTMVRRTTRNDKPDTQPADGLRLRQRMSRTSIPRSNSSPEPSGKSPAAENLAGLSADQLLQAALAGSEPAFDELSERHRVRLYRLAKRILRNKSVFRTEHVEHVVDATLDLAKAIFPWRYEHQSAIGYRRWLNRLMANQVRDRLKYVFAGLRDERHERSTGTDDEDGGLAPLVELLAGPIDAPVDIVIEKEAREEMHQRLLRIFHALQPVEQMLFALFYFVGFSWAEIAELLHLRSPEAARMAKSRALEKLKKNLR